MFGTTLARLTVAVAACTAMLLLAAGCGDSESGEEVVRERDGVRMTLSVNDVSFRPGETVELSLEAENLRDAPLTYGFVPADEPPLQLSITSDLVGKQILNAGDDPLGDANLTLEAGEKIATAADWDQGLAIYVDPVQAPEGEYTVTARLMVDDPAGGTAPLELTAAVSVALRGGEQILPLAEAVKTAIQQPELREWMADRTATSAVCQYQTTGVFISALLANDLVQDALPQLYQIQLENGRPVCSPVSAGGEWRVQFFASGGPEPNTVAVYMDIHTGENTRWKAGDLEPLVTPSP